MDKKQKIDNLLFLVGFRFTYVELLTCTVSNDHAVWLKIPTIFDAKVRKLLNTLSSVAGFLFVVARSSSYSHISAKPSQFDRSVPTCPPFLNYPWVSKAIKLRLLPNKKFKAKYSVFRKFMAFSQNEITETCGFVLHDPHGSGI